MNDKRCISIIGLSSLEALGMRYALRESWNGRIETFSSFGEFIPFAEKMDAFIVSSDIYACNIDFFLPRKQKTLLVSRVAVNTNHPSGYHIISSNWDLAEIKGTLDRLISRLENSEEPKGELSAREIEVLRLIAAGKLNKEIADTLCISVNTVITHRKNLSSKLGIKSASGLSLYAMMNGII